MNVDGAASAARVVLVAAIVLAGCGRSGPPSRIAQDGLRGGRTAELTLADLDMNALEAEAKARGVDLSAGSTSRAVREAFLYLQLADRSAKLGGDKALRQAALTLADGLAATGATSVLRVQTSRPGAAVMYRSIASKVPITASKLTNETLERVPIGYYFIWAVRDGNHALAGSVYRVVERVVEVQLAEP